MSRVVDRGTAAGDGPGVLYVVATPIGNLGDVTLRSLEVLRAVPLIAAEDTRLTRRLLDRHGIATRTTSYHARSTPARLTSLLEHLRAGEDLALVSDAGTPLVSDPGGDLVSAWGREGGRVVPVPGASSVMAALAASGVAGPRWAFEGFLARSGRDRRHRLAAIAADPRGCVLFESPNRVAGTLRDLVEACGATRSAAICRELTKVHEQVVRASLAELVVAIADGSIPARGEFVIVVGMADAGTLRTAGRSVRDASVDASDDATTLAAALADVDRIVESGVARGEAARRVAAATGIPRRRLYGGTPGR